MFQPVPDSAAPDFCEAITAWRLWIVRTPYGTPYLTGIGNGHQVTWPPYEALKAQHIVNPDVFHPQGVCAESPCDLIQGCGLYGHKTAAEIRAAVLHYRPDFWYQEQIVVGEVSLWGRIVEHEGGYRAQVAYPKRFVYGHQCDAAQVAAAYGVPFEEDASWKSVIQYAALSQSRYLHQSLFGSSPIFSPSPSVIPALRSSPHARSIPLLFRLNSYRLDTKKFNAAVAQQIKDFEALIGKIYSLPPYLCARFQPGPGQGTSRYTRRRRQFKKTQAP